MNSLHSSTQPHHTCFTHKRHTKLDLHSVPFSPTSKIRCCRVVSLLDSISIKLLGELNITDDTINSANDDTFKKSLGDWETYRIKSIEIKKYYHLNQRYNICLGFQSDSKKSGF